MATVYDINKGINQSIEFKGIKAQYIIYLALGLVFLLVLFAILFVSGLKIYYCLGIVLPVGGVFVALIQHLSRTYGESGLSKKMASFRLPRAVRCRSRRLFIDLKSIPDEKK